MLLLLRGARAASAASTAVDAGAGRSISIRLTAVAALSSGGRRRKGQRRGVAKPPSPSPPPPPPQPLPRHGETPSSNKKSGARTSVEAKKSHPAEMERARGPQSPERGEERKGRRVWGILVRVGGEGDGLGRLRHFFPNKENVFSIFINFLQFYKAKQWLPGWPFTISYLTN